MEIAIYLFSVVGVVAAFAVLAYGISALFGHNRDIERLKKRHEYAGERIDDIWSYNRKQEKADRELADRVTMLEEVIQDSVVEFLTDNIDTKGLKKKAR